ncbi:hypothetical protein SESBI_03621 [Sesbania bispinosa]|nr:hypothetical protein SESBI_03621 [Sesbania bispinosa]
MGPLQSVSMPSRSRAFRADFSILLNVTMAFPASPSSLLPIVAKASARLFSVLVMPAPPDVSDGVPSNFMHHHSSSRASQTFAPGISLFMSSETSSSCLPAHIAIMSTNTWQLSFCGYMIWISYSPSNNAHLLMRLVTKALFNMYLIPSDLLITCTVCP